MLVLTRRLGERIMIGSDIVVEVVDIDRGKIRLGIIAPRDIYVAREELLKNGAGPRNPKATPEVSTPTELEGGNGSA